MARQRHANWTPVIVSNGGDQTEVQTKVSKADDWGPARSVLHVKSFDLLPEDTTTILDRKIQRRADLRFAILRRSRASFTGVYRPWRLRCGGVPSSKSELKTCPKVSAAGTVLAARKLIAAQKLL